MASIVSARPSKCKGSHHSHRRKAIPVGLHGDMIEAIQAARALFSDPTQLARTTAAVLEELGHGAKPAVLSRLEQQRAQEEVKHLRHSYYLQVSEELRTERDLGSGLVIERAVYGDLGLVLTDKNDRVAALSGTLWLPPGAAFSNAEWGRCSCQRVRSMATSCPRAILEAKLESGRLVDVTEAVQSQVEVTWEVDPLQRVATCRLPENGKAQLPGFHDPCPDLEGSHPKRGLLVRYRFGGRVHVAVRQDLEPLRIPLRSHDAMELIRRVPPSLRDALSGHDTLPPRAKLLPEHEAFSSKASRSASDKENEPSRHSAAASKATPLTSASQNFVSPSRRAKPPAVPLTSSKISTRAYAPRLEGQSVERQLSSKPRRMAPVPESKSEWSGWLKWAATAVLSAGAAWAVFQAWKQSEEPSFRAWAAKSALHVARQLPYVRNHVSERV
jgi:hypothetical protein